jgi:hypothetical protein
MGGSKGSGASTQTVQQELSPEQQKLLGMVTPIAEETLAKGVQLYPGSTIAGFDPLETQASQQAVQVANNALPAINADALSANNMLLSGRAGTLDNPALQGAIDAATRPIIDNLTQQILPNIRSGAVTAGGMGGSRQGIAEGLSSQGAMRAVGETSAGIANEAFLRGLQGQVSALGLVPQTQQAMLAPTNILGAVGAQNRAMEQALLTEESQKFINEQLIQFELAKQVAGLAFGMPGGGTTATTLAPGSSGPGALQGALGGAATGASLGAMFGPWGALIGGAGGALMGGLSAS